MRSQSARVRLVARGLARIQGQWHPSTGPAPAAQLVLHGQASPAPGCSVVLLRHDRELGGLAPRAGFDFPCTINELIERMKFTGAHLAPTIIRKGRGLAGRKCAAV